MALKIWKDGAMKKIDTNLHKPVIFIEGTKHKLDKAYTFVNGVKHELWGAGGVQIDYISSTGTLAGGNIFAIGEDWANVWYNNSILRLDISNLSLPSLLQSVAWGNINKFNADYQGTATNSVFASFNYNNYTGYKLLLNNSDGTMVVDKSSVLSATSSYTNSKNLLGITNNSIVNKLTETLSWKPTTINHERVFWNGTEKYAFSQVFNGLMQVADNSILAITSNYGTIYSCSESDYTAVGTGFDRGVYDNGYMYCQSNNASGKFITKRASNDIPTVLYRYPTTADNTTNYKIIGMIGDYIYCLKTPVSSTSTSEVKLLLLNKSDLTVAFERVLPNDPFNENNGLPTFWTNCTMQAQFSRTGFLGVSTYNAPTLGLRIARFSGLI